MGKRLAVVSLVVLAALVILPTIAALADGSTSPQGGERVILKGEGNPGGVVYTRGVVVPAVPVPPGVLGANSPLPCVVPGGGRGAPGGNVWQINATDRD